MVLVDAARMGELGCGQLRLTRVVVVRTRILRMGQSDLSRGEGKRCLVESGGR